MKAIKIKFDKEAVAGVNKLKVASLFSILLSHGFAISNHANTSGDYLTVIVEGRRRIAGMDMFLQDGDEFPIFDYETDLRLIIDWIKDHELKYGEYIS